MEESEHHNSHNRPLSLAENTDAHSSCTRGEWIHIFSRLPVAIHKWRARPPWSTYPPSGLHVSPTVMRVMLAINSRHGQRQSQQSWQEIESAVLASEHSDSGSSELRVEGICIVVDARSPTLESKYKTSPNGRTNI